MLCVAVAWCFSAGLAARSVTPNRFHAIATSVRTDKVNDHHYEHLYEKYLQPLSNQTLRLLEGKAPSLAHDCLRKEDLDM